MCVYTDLRLNLPIPLLVLRKWTRLLAFIIKNIKLLTQNDDKRTKWTDISLQGVTVLNCTETFQKWVGIVHICINK